MVIESGIIIFIGFLFLILKLPKWQIAWMLGKPLQVDLAAAVLAYVLHWGTFTGVMAAAVAGLMVSAMTSIGRQLAGYTFYDRDGKEYVYRPGMINLFRDAA